VRLCGEAAWHWYTCWVNWLAIGSATMQIRLAEMVPGLRDVELDIWLLCSEEACDALSSRPQMKMYCLDVRLRLVGGPLN
jgi:hypothetical protein